MASGIPKTESIMKQQQSYYRALATEYDDHRLDQPGGDELLAAVASFAPAGKVLELACGPATWTQYLMRSASSVTAVDGAPEMLAVARRRIPDPRVRFVEADIFAWHPSDTYDAVLFGFWLRS